jgi:hypothetical protein
MLPESPGLAAGDDLLAEVVGFLEACQGRMMELIEAGTQGQLSEEVFEHCLRVNDALTRTLEAEKVSAGTAAAAAAGVLTLLPHCYSCQCCCCCHCSFNCACITACLFALFMRPSSCLVLLCLSVTSVP